MPARDWLRRRSYHHADFPVERLAAARDASVSVCVPAREEAATIGAIVRGLAGLRDAGVVDQVVVVDASSADGTGALAAAAGAEVFEQGALLPEFGPVLGKGDAMWRALTVLRGEVVVFLDADSEDFGPHFACGLLGPLLCEPGVEYVKGTYRRPFKVEGVASPGGGGLATTLPEGGGRVTELTARPLLRRFYPELAAFGQPLAGEIAARRSLLERLPWSTGYAVEVGQLIDAWAEVGLWAMAQVDLDVRQNRHQALSALGPMADGVTRAVLDRLVRDGRLAADAVSGDPIVERPPIASLGARTAA